MTLSPRFAVDPLDIRDALADELIKTEKEAVFMVEARELEGEIWKLQVRPNGRGGGEVLDDALEGQNAWWPGPPRGAADVLSVIPDQHQINLRFATGKPPGPQERLFVYPPKYLEALKTVWADRTCATACERWVSSALSANGFSAQHAVKADRVPYPLRAAQRAAFQLPGWNVAFLWGPPGTGKTYTLGALVGAYLLQFPGARVLLLSTTNAAVDQALLSVDQALEAYGQSALGARRGCQRVGNHFTGARYVGREHLVPSGRPELVRRLAELEAAMPPAEDVARYAEWKLKTDGVRTQLRQAARTVLRQARLSALTTTAAAFLFEALREQGVYDLLVFDEASQVGIAHALALAPLARRAIFAGDPQQLQPIVQSETSAAQRWLGRSMFEAMSEEHRSTCFLPEQSRMAEPICALVSHAFYGGKLKVADNARKDQAWLAFRRWGSGVFPTPHVAIEVEEFHSTWSKSYGGPIRYASASRIAEVMSALVEGVGAERVIVLTPFRAQRALIRRMLRDRGHRNVRVSTVHRAQGSEEHTVVFDPVDGASPFFEKVGDRLINVALSRAQGRLLVLLAPTDLANAKLRQIFEIVRLSSPGAKPAAVPPLSGWVHRTGFPQCVIGEVVSIGSMIGEVQEANAEHIVVRDAISGLVRKFRTASILNRASDPTQSQTDREEKKENPWAEALKPRQKPLQSTDPEAWATRPRAAGPVRATPWRKVGS